MWLHVCFLEMTSTGIAVVIRPVAELVAVRELTQILRSIPTVDEAFEDRPELLHMFSVLLISRLPIRFDRHPKGLHHRLQAAFRTEPI